MTNPNPPAVVVEQSTHAEPAGPIDGDAVERVAKALSCYLWATIPADNHDDCGEFEDMPENVKDIYRNAAIAALAALPDIATLTAQLDEMKAAGDALAGFAGHDDQCAKHLPPYPDDCSCGYTTALLTYRTTTGEPT